MRYRSDKDVMKEMNINLEDYGFKLCDMRIGANGIQRTYKDASLFENYVLQIVSSLKGLNVKLIDEAGLIIFDDDLSIEIIKLYYMDRICLGLLIEVIISTIDDYLEGVDIDE